MSTEAIDLIHDGDRIAGVRAKTPAGVIDIDADLTVACATAAIRWCAGRRRPRRGRGNRRAGMDVLWFRAGKRETQAKTCFALRRLPAGVMVTFESRRLPAQRAWVVIAKEAV